MLRLISFPILFLHGMVVTQTLKVWSAESLAAELVATV